MQDWNEELQAAINQGRFSEDPNAVTAHATLRDNGGFDVLPKCANCSKEAGIHRCANCKQVRYCSPTCQKEHWKAGHKAKCQKHYKEVYDSTSVNHTEKCVEIPRCAVCKGTDFLSHCSRCQKVYYCGQAHQRAHWKQHKPDCKKA